MVQLAIALSEEGEDHIQAAAAWALGQIGRHTPEHSKAVAVANVLPKLSQAYLRTDASEDLQTKVNIYYFAIKSAISFSALVKKLEGFGEYLLFCNQKCHIV